MNWNCIGTLYGYTPFGPVSASENGVVRPFQWSSEFYGSELDLVYYNYRHYSPSLGRFLSRDPIAEQGGWGWCATFKRGKMKSAHCFACNFSL